ncbi:MAG: hypothetical protein QOH32_447 [Bradyrhizobium sp.]|jgi:hypothetical protein|nr:hypothetical protein [Bradyrhizobium sp.]
MIDMRNFFLGSIAAGAHANRTKVGLLSALMPTPITAVLVGRFMGNVTPDSPPPEPVPPGPGPAPTPDDVKKIAQEVKQAQDAAELAQAAAKQAEGSAKMAQKEADRAEAAAKK